MDVLNENQEVTTTGNGVDNYLYERSASEAGTECDTNGKGSTREELRIGSPTIQLNDEVIGGNPISDDSEKRTRDGNVMNNSGDQINPTVVRSGSVANGSVGARSHSSNNIKTSDEIIVAISEDETPMDVVFNGVTLTEECKSASVPALTPTMFDHDEEGEERDLFERFVNGSFAHQSYNTNPLVLLQSQDSTMFAQSLDTGSVMDRSGRRTTVAIAESRGMGKCSRKSRHPLRRAHSLGSTSLLNQGTRPSVAVLTGRTRKLYCPRQPPTTLTRTLSIARSNIETHKKSKRLTLKQKSILFSISMVSITSFLCMSIMAPFFPNEASNKGMSETVSGFVFSFYALIVMISSPILGSLLPVIGAKFMLISGIFASGVANILFGTLDRIIDLTSFTVFCFIVRAMEAIGVAAFSTASYTYIMYVFPDDIGTAFGLTETCVGIGMSLGPAVGAGLYALGGYGLPFYVLGTFVLLNIPLCWYVIDPIASKWNILLLGAFFPSRRISLLSLRIFPPS